MLGGLIATRGRTKKSVIAARKKYLLYLIIVLCCVLAVLPGAVFWWRRHKNSSSDGMGTEESTEARPPTRRDSKCHPETKVYSVGGCEPLFTVTRLCPTNPEAEEQILRDIENKLSVHVHGTQQLRELRKDNGALLDLASSETWPKVYALCDKEMFVFPTCNVGEVFTVELPSVGVQMKVEVKSNSPRVLAVDNFLSDLECDALIATARSQMNPSTVSAQGDTAKNIFEQSRTSSTAWLQPGSYPLAKKLRTRVGELIGIEFDKHPHVVTEDLQVLRYEIDQHYHTHHDYFEPELHRGFLQNDGRNRFITVFFYLTDVAKGGETMFPMAGDDRPVTDWADCSRGLKVPPRKGNAVIFYSLLPDGQQSGGLDVKSWHAGCDVKEGVKWGANYWISLKGVHPDKVKAPGQTSNGEIQILESGTASVS